MKLWWLGGLALVAQASYALEPFGEEKLVAPIEDMLLVNAPKPFLLDIFEADWELSRDPKAKPASIRKFEDAKAACAKQGKRLPTRQEWMQAASNLGRNKKFTLAGDRIIDPATQKPLANVAGAESLPTRDDAALGIDAIGTVGMTGNRAEWVIDGDTPYQCGGGYEVVDLEEVTFAKICSRKEDDRWRRHDLSATVRCALDYDPANPPATRRSAQVSERLKAYLLAHAVEPRQPPASVYAQLKARCESLEEVYWTQALPDLGGDGTRVYPLLEIASDRDPANPRAYLSCADFTGVDAPTALPTGGAFSRALVVPDETLKAWSQNARFQSLTVASPTAFAERLRKDALFVDSDTVKARYPTIAALLAKRRLQEAAWEFNRLGAPAYAKIVRNRLEQSLQRQDFVSQTPFKIEKNVSSTERVVLKDGLNAIFKNTVFQEDNYLSEVAAYRIDVLLGLDVVPASVVRTDPSGKAGALMYWIHDAKTFAEIKLPTALRSARMLLLDNLIHNIDRHDRNILVINLGGNPLRQVAIDHNRCCNPRFEPSNNPIPPMGPMPNAKIFARLRSLTDEDLATTLKDLVDKEGIAIMQIKRAQLVSDFEKRIAAGESGLFEEP